LGDKLEPSQFKELMVLNFERTWNEMLKPHFASTVEDFLKHHSCVVVEVAYGLPQEKVIPIVNMMYEDS
jgi:hypothetical protein